MTRKVASTNKTLETISTRMDAFASTIKNQHSFNKMVESQLAQLAATIPPLEKKGKISGQPEDLETTNLVDIYNATNYYIESPEVKWIDYTLPDKKCDPGRPVIPIFIRYHIFQEVICDFGASVNIMPKVIYDKILGDPLLYTNMHLQFVDQTLCYPEGALEDAIIRVGQSYVPVDFVVVDTGGDEKSLIILGRPFLCTTKAIIYVEHAKIVFTIKDKKEKFSFRSRMLHTPARPHAPYKRDEPVKIIEKKKNHRRGERRQHQHQHHKKSKHLILLQDQMMHLNSEYSFLPNPVRRTIKFRTLATR
jgi:hypothetical protein